MNELEFAERVLSTMRDIYGVKTDREILNRTVVSRLYYGLHHLGRCLLRVKGEKPENWRRDMHRKVMDALERAFVLPGEMDRSIFLYLGEMRRERVKADYRLDRTFTDEKVEKLFENYELFLAEFKRLTHQEAIQDG